MTPLEPGALFTVRCDDLPWQASALAPGLTVKNVAVAGGLELQIVRLEPGARVPPHRHDLPEFLYVLEGELELAGQTLGPGCASVAATGSEHVDVHSTRGCTFVLVDRPL